jgi:hypothetical protein
MCSLAATHACESNENIPSAFFKYGKSEPNIYCDTSN